MSENPFCAGVAIYERWYLQERGLDSARFLFLDQRLGELCLWAVYTNNVSSIVLTLVLTLSWRNSGLWPLSRFSVLWNLLRTASRIRLACARTWIPRPCLKLKPLIHECLAIFRQTIVRKISGTNSILSSRSIPPMRAVFDEILVSDCLLSVFQREIACQLGMSCFRNPITVLIRESNRNVFRTCSNWYYGQYRLVLSKCLLWLCYSLPDSIRTARRT